MRKFNKQFAGLAICLGSALAVQPAVAQNIQGSSMISVSADSNLGNGTSRFPLSEMIDGNKSDAGPYNGYQARNGATGTITFTLDKAYDLTSFHLWNDINVRAEGVQGYKLRFYNSAGGVIGSDVSAPNTIAGQVPQHVTNFSKAGVKRVDMIVTSVRQTTGIRRVEIREVAFSGKPARGIGTGNGPKAAAYRCYDLTQHASQPDRKRFNMVDQFGQTTTMVGHPVQLCNPVALNKRGMTSKTMAQKFKAHLVCYELFDFQSKSNQQRHVKVTNRFGNNHLSTGHADQICVVSTKEHTRHGPPPIRRK